MTDYAWNIQPRSVTVHFSNGDDFVWPENHPNLTKVRDAIKARAPADELRALMDVVSTIKAALSPVAKTGTGITVTRDGVFYGGEEIHMSVTERIIQHASEGLPIEPLCNFLEKLLGGNQRREAVLSLYDFLEANNIPITEDGDFITYKKVRNDYKDIHSGTFDNSVGAKPRVAAWQVEADRDQTCAKGLHVCSRAYLPNFGNGPGNRVVICKVNPADVVAVPRDYNNSKMRVCGYEVIGELNDKQKADIFDNVKIVRPGDFSDAVTWDESWAKDDDEAMDEDNDCYDCGNSEDDCECYSGSENDPFREEDEPEPEDEGTDNSCDDPACPICSPQSAQPSQPTGPAETDSYTPAPKRPWWTGFVK